jgi:outer membrane protein
MRLWTIAAAAFAALMASSGAALANPFEGKLAVKVGVAGVLPDEAAEIRPIGGTVDISDEYVPALQLEWFFTEAVSVELLCCLAPHEVKAVRTAAGTIDLGEVTLFPPTLTAKYRFFAGGPVQPYVGAGINATVFFDEKLPAGPVRSIDYETTFGAALQVGVDVPVSERFFLNLDVKKVWIEPEVSLATALGPVTADVEINPIVAFLGVGYRF